MPRRATGRAAAAATGVLAALLLAGEAGARNLHLTQVGAALALPFLTDPDGISTKLTITNALSAALELQVQVIDGDPGDPPSAPGFRCRVTGRETTVLTFTSLGPGRSRIDLECTSSPETGSGQETERVEAVDAGRGIVFVSVVYQGRVVSEDGLLGDAVILDSGAGLAWSVNAIPLQAGTANDGDGEYRFDGLEYAPFPAVVAAQFQAPDERTETRLVLFTLDGQVGFPAPAQAAIHFWNDDEVRRSTSVAFEGFAILDLARDVDPRFRREFLGSATGHLQLESFSTAYPSPHDRDGLRRVPIHGWILHTLWREDGAVAWGQVLRQSTTRFVPREGDVPALQTGLPREPGGL